MASDSLPSLNATIARLTYMTNGKIGRDWYSGRPFVAAGKGDEFAALVEALDALRVARDEIERFHARRRQDRAR